MSEWKFKGRPQARCPPNRQPDGERLAISTPADACMADWLCGGGLADDGGGQLS